MAADKVFRNTQLTADTANLIFEQPLQRFAKLQFHIFRKSTHIVVALDNTTCDIKAFNTVWVDGTLPQPLCIGNLLSLGIEHIDKALSYNLTLLFRFFNTSQFLIEFFASVNANNVQAQTLVIVQNILELIFPKQAIINEYTGQILADGLIQKDSSHT